MGSERLWPVQRLDTVAEIIDSLHQTPTYASEGLPMVRVTDVRGGFLDLSNAVLVTPAVYEAFTRRHKPKPGDIVFSRVGTYGNASYVSTERPFCLGQNTAIISPKINPRFLHLCLQSPLVRKQIEQLVVGSTQRTISLKSISSIRVPVPSQHEQEEIVQVVGSIDDKIELNRRMNRTLEAIAHAIFKSSFVDFDQIPKSNRVDSELGPIPSGWQVVSLGDHADAIRGLSYKGEGLSTEGMPMHNLNSIFEGGGYKYEGIKYYRGEFKDRHLLEAGDLIIANTEQGFDYLLIGYPAIVPRRFGEKGLFSHHLFRVTPRAGSPVTGNFLYYLLMTPSVRDQVIACTNGTTVNALSLDGLTIPRFVLPPIRLIQQFEQIAKPIHQLLATNVETNQTLAALRDTLLPKLILGEIRLKGAESALARTV